MVVSLAEIQAAQSTGLNIASTLGVDYEALSLEELKKFELAFNRQFVWNKDPREIVAYKSHLPEILAGAAVAKVQMKSVIDGERPESNRIGGPIPIRAAYFGIGDDWEDVSSFSTGAPQDWIHSGTAALGGTAGRPIRIGSNAVHVIIGVGSYHVSPKIESVSFQIDGKGVQVLITKPQLLQSDLKIKWLDDAVILWKDRTFKAQVFISAALGTTVEDIPYLVGVSFVKEGILNIHDPATIFAALPTYDLVLTT